MSEEIDNGYKDNGIPFRRFYMRRLKDETGVSRTGRVLEGVVTQTGLTFLQWRPPLSTLGVYLTFQHFLTIHVDCHPSCNEVIWLDFPSRLDEGGQRWYQGPDGTWGLSTGGPDSWHCLACGAGGNIGNFCCMCGSHAADYHGSFAEANGAKRLPRHPETERINRLVTEFQRGGDPGTAARRLTLQERYAEAKFRGDEHEMQSLREQAEFAGVRYE